MHTILIADDDPVMIKLLEFSLRRQGYAVLICHDGLSVQSRARQTPPDLAIFDLMLPGLSGQQLIRDFQADPELRRIPIIVVTGQGGDRPLDSLIKDGAVEVFTKPFSPSLLMSRIASIIAGKPQDKDEHT